MHMSPKVNSSRLYGSFQMSKIQQKLFLHEALRSKSSPASSGKPSMWQLYHYCNVKRSILNGIKQFVYQKSSEKWGKPLFSTRWLIFVPAFQKKLRDQRFSTPVEAANAFKMHILEIPQSEWKRCFENWFKCMQKCINLHGAYFEKQWSHFRWLSFVIFSLFSKYKRQPS